MIAKLVYWSVVLLSSVSFWLLATAPAVAMTIRGSETACNVLGNVLVNTAQASIAGVPWEQYGPYMHDMANDAKGKPNSIVQDDEDVGYVNALVKTVFDHPSPDVIENAVKSCIEAAPVKKMKYV